MSCLKVQSDLNNLSKIRSFINKAAEKLEFTNETTAEIVLAVDEACANIITHGYKNNKGHITITLLLKDKKMIVTLNDNAPLYNPLKAPPPPDINTPLSGRPLGGMGLKLVKLNTDSIEYKTTSNDGNTLILTKYG